MNKIRTIYNETKLKFEEWSKSDSIEFRNAACPETLRKNKFGPSEIGDKFGFSILWTSPKFEAEILFCGCCVTSFGDLEANQLNLSGELPTRNSCIDSKHKFGQTIQAVFESENRMDLLEGCVGMNLWHFQYVGSPFSNQFHKEVRQFCEENTIEIIKFLRPKRIVTLHNLAAKRLKRTFPDIKALKHPSFQNGLLFNEQMRELIRQEF